MTDNSISADEFANWKRRRASYKDMTCDKRICTGHQYCVESRTDICCRDCFVEENGGIPLEPKHK